MPTTPTVLLVGGLDPGGQAGLAADLEVCALQGVLGRPVVTARTAQTDRKWLGAWPTALAELETTLAAALADGRPRACKTGMLGSLATARLVARAVAGHPMPLVVDPLLSTTSGGWLWGDEPHADVRAMFLHELLPACAVVTPNWPELAWLAEAPLATDLGEAEAQARRLPCPVLLKGGHAPERWLGQDFLFADGQFHPLSNKIGWPPLADGAPRNLRGTGCRLATAVAVGLAKGMTLPSAAEQASEWLDQWALAKILP